MVQTREDAAKTYPAVTAALVALNQGMFPRDHAFGAHQAAANAETGNYVSFWLGNRQWSAQWAGQTLSVAKIPFDDLPTLAMLCHP